MRIATTTLLLLLAAPSLAQTADTTSAWRYMPLHEDNVWEYEQWTEECITFDICTTELTGYARWQVEGDSAVGGTAYKQLRIDTFSAERLFGGSRVELVRFDTSAAAGYRRLEDGGELYWPGEIPCRLDAPFGPETVCYEGADGVFVSEFEHVPVVVDGAAETRPSKHFASLIPWSEYVADVGLRSDGAVEFGGAWRALTYARNGTVIYGEERFPVASEPIASPPSGVALSSYPNPVRDAAMVSFALDRTQRTTLAVYDILGRRVLVEDLGALPPGARPHRLDLAALRPGVYVVQLTGDAGARATTRLVVQ